MVPVQTNLCHWTQNILLDNFLYEKCSLTITEQLIAIKRLTILKPHQFDTKFMLLPKRHGQCTSITSILQKIW